jgi:hypothetical protein
MTTHNDKIVLVITYVKAGNGEDQDVAAILDGLRDSVDETDLWIQDEDHDVEVPYSFTVERAEVVDADVVETDVS